MSNEKDNLGFMIGEDIYVEFDMDNMIDEDENGNVFVNTHVYRVVSSNEGEAGKERVPYDEMSEEVMERVETAVNSFLTAALRRGMEEEGIVIDDAELFDDPDVVEIEVDQENQV
jgi:hypothetical protein